jgi:hypothetical protein
VSDCSPSRPDKQTTRVRGFGFAAKRIQAKPNKTKQKGLDLLGFIRPNRAFSMGYGQSK